MLQVRGLAASLEASLNAREGIKKPTGSVDLHDTMKSTEGAAFKPSMVIKSFSYIFVILIKVTALADQLFQSKEGMEHLINFLMFCVSFFHILYYLYMVQHSVKYS